VFASGRDRPAVFGARALEAFVAVAAGACLATERLDELLCVLLVKLWIRALLPLVGSALEPLNPFLFQCLFPLRDSCSGHSVISGDLSLTLLTFQKFLSGGESPLLVLFRRERDRTREMLAHGLPTSVACQAYPG
jgi:hypothetical protein